MTSSEPPHQLGPSLMNDAVAAHAALSSRPFVCCWCSKSYTRSEHLKRHIEQKHTDSREHVCKHCGRAFARRDVLKKHEQLHLRDSQPSAIGKSLSNSDLSSLSGNNSTSSISSGGESGSNGSSYPPVSSPATSLSAHSTPQVGHRAAGKPGDLRDGLANIITSESNRPKRRKLSQGGRISPRPSLSIVYGKQPPSLDATDLKAPSSAPLLVSDGISPVSSAPDAQSSLEGRIPPYTAPAIAPYASSAFSSHLNRSTGPHQTDYLSSTASSSSTLRYGALSGGSKDPQTGGGVEQASTPGTKLDLSQTEPRLDGHVYSAAQAGQPGGSSHASTRLHWHYQIAAPRRLESPSRFRLTNDLMSLKEEELESHAEFAEGFNRFTAVDSMTSSNIGYQAPNKPDQPGSLLSVPRPNDVVGPASEHDPSLTTPSSVPSSLAFAIHEYGGRQPPEVSNTQQNMTSSPTFAPTLPDDHQEQAQRHPIQTNGLVHSTGPGSALQNGVNGLNNTPPSASLPPTVMSLPNDSANGIVGSASGGMPRITNPHLHSNGISPAANTPSSATTASPRSLPSFLLRQPNRARGSSVDNEGAQSLLSLSVRTGSYPPPSLYQHSSGPESPRVQVIGGEGSMMKQPGIPNANIKPVTDASGEPLGPSFIDPGPEMPEGAPSLESVTAGLQLDRWSIESLEKAYSNAVVAVRKVAAYPCHWDKLFYIPDAHTLGLFVSVYFKDFHRYIPILHEPTFDVEECHWLLLLAIAMIGARFSCQHKRGEALFQTSLTCLWAICAAGPYRPNATMNHIWLYQAHLLQRWYRLTALPQSCRLAVPGDYLYHWLSDSPPALPADAPLTSVWRAWIFQQKKKRLSLSYMYFYSLDSLLTETTMYLPGPEILAATVPDTSSLWAATTAEEWDKLRNSTSSPRSILEAMQSFLDPIQAEAAFSLLQSDTATARMIYILHRVFHGQAYLMQSMVSQMWTGNIVSASIGPQVAGFSEAHDRLHGILFSHGQRTWYEPQCKPCFTIMPHLLAISGNIRFSVLRAFAANKEGERRLSRAQICVWLGEKDGTVARTDLWRAAQIWHNVMNMDYDQRCHFMTSFCIFYSACILYAYSSFAKLAIASTYDSGGQLVHLVAPPSAPVLELDEFPDSHHPSIEAWIHKRGSFRPFLGPKNGTGVEESLTNDSDPQKLVRNAIWLLESIKVWPETCTEFADILRSTLKGEGSPPALHS